MNIEKLMEHHTRGGRMIRHSNGQKEYILSEEDMNNIKKLVKESDSLPCVSNSFCDLNPDFQQYLIEQGETKCKQCGKKLKAK